MTIRCGRCKKAIRGGLKNAETCWWCLEPLCAACWDDVGHCGHPEAKAINELGTLASDGKASPMPLSALIATPMVTLKEMLAAGRRR